jgi:MFS family permease
MSLSASSVTGLIHQRPFVLFWLARLAATIGYQMLALTIGWKIYEITGSAFDLGLVGLIQFVPAVVLTLLIGHTADRYDLRLIVRGAQCIHALAAIMITVALLAGVLTRELLFGAVFLIGCARAFELPTRIRWCPRWCRRR